MARRSFTIHAKWDEDAKVFYCESDIIGLHIEAETLEEFEQLAIREAPELIIANHMTKPELARASFADLIPTIFVTRPDLPLALSS